MKLLSRMRQGAVSRRAERMPFTVHYLGCPDGDRLVCTLEFSGGVPDSLVLQVDEVPLAAAEPLEVRGRFARFDLDLGGLVSDPIFAGSRVSLSIGRRRFPLSAPHRSLATDGPSMPTGTWLSIVGTSTEARLERRTRNREAVVTETRSTAAGVRVSLAEHADGMRFERRDGAVVHAEKHESSFEFDLMRLPAQGDAGPAYWRCVASIDGCDVRTVSAGIDLFDASTTYFIPALVFRGSDGVAYYAKPYFAKGTGQLSVRTGIKLEDDQ